MRYLIIFLSTTLFLIGCGGGEDTPAPAEPVAVVLPPAPVPAPPPPPPVSGGGDGSGSVSRSSQGIDNNIAERRSDALYIQDQQRLDIQGKSSQKNITTKNSRPDRENRTFNGFANNLTQLEWGATFQHLERMTPSAYSDGAASMAGASLKNAREISNILMGQAEGEVLPNPFGASDFVWQWGQFIDHDLDLTDGSADEPHPINIPIGDVHFDPTSTGSAQIPFNRAAHDPNTGTEVGNPREQDNEITSWLDGSMVYGPSEARADALRETGTPYLKTSSGNLLPFNEDSINNANGFYQDPTVLFLAGDVRANEQLGLTVMHTLFVREHNRIVDVIKVNNPSSTADELFQDARRIVIAEIQKITFEEFLPALIGANTIPAYSGYDDTVNPNIMNEFSVAAYRLGHSMVSDSMWRLNSFGDEIGAGHIALRDVFFKGPQILKQSHQLDPILRGLAAKEHQVLDTKLVNNLRNFLFGPPGAGGLDLAALNIQRGRDHGIGSYNDAREAMGLNRHTSFADISSNVEMQNLLAQAYDDIDDVELWVGGLAEDADLNNGSQVGELYRKVIAKQFSAIRDGDRFWYEGDYLTSDEKALVANSSLAIRTQLKENEGN